jgi:hypothetical protein
MFFNNPLAPCSRKVLLMTLSEIVELTLPSLSIEGQHEAVDQALQAIETAWRQINDTPHEAYLRLVVCIRNYCQKAGSLHLYGHVAIATALLVTINRHLTQG